jgi:hypothetical protein
LRITPEKQSHTWFHVLAGMVLALGAWLRLRGVGGVQIFADELHSLRVVAEKSYAWVASHFYYNDACIPYTLLNKLLADTVGLNELLMRLPEVLAGTMLLAVVLWLGRRIVGMGPALATAGFLALSPLFVYLSRDARPYSMAMLLITAGGLLLADRANAARAGLLCLAAVLLALAVYFLPLVAPGAAVLWMLPLVHGLLRGRDGWLRAYVRATGLGVLVGVLTLGPTLSTFGAGVISKAGLGQAGLETAGQGLLLLHGLPVPAPVWLWVALALAGMLCSPGKTRVQAGVVLAAVLVQLLAMHLLGPLRMEIPWVWIRYWVHLVPLLLLFILAGYAEAFRRWFRGRVVTGLLCAGLLAGYGIMHARAQNYGTAPHAAYPVHPMAMMLNFGPDMATATPGARFYAEVLPTLDDDALLVESPRIYVFPLYGRYAGLHGRAIKTAAAGDGFLQHLPDQGQGFCFRTTWPRADAPPCPEAESHAFGTERPVYWVHHYNIKQELRDWMDLARTNKHAWAQLKDFASTLESPRSQEFWYGTDQALREFVPPKGVLMYADAYVRVYQVPANGAAALTRR